MDLYYMPLSAPSRAVLMTAAALKIELNKKFIDLLALEHETPAYEQINPQKRIPTLVDHGFKLSESRAIMIYLMQQYGKKDTSLYPECPQKRAVINQRLFFDMSLYDAFAVYTYTPIFRRVPHDPQLLDKLYRLLDNLNTFLEHNSYAAGDALTLADFSLLATISSFDVAGVDLQNYANILGWYERCKQNAPGAEENWAGCLEFKEFLAHLRVKSGIKACYKPKV